MSRRKPRSLRPEEKELWEKVARTARRTAPEKLTKAAAEELIAEPTATKNASGKELTLRPFEIGSKAARNLHPAAVGPSVNRAPKMDVGRFQKLRRGKLKPEARIDLHGKTAADAQADLTSFLFRAHASGKRLVLVITGKGRSSDDSGPIPSRPGVLRRSLPQWVSRPPLSSIVLETTEAHLRHGGSGAFYVYLRRAR